MCKTLRTVRLGAVAAILLALAGCEPAVLVPRGPIAAANRTLLIDSLAIMLAIVVPTIIATLVFAWWFRASNTRARHMPDWAFSGRIEIVVWFIPLLTILLLGGVAWIGAHQLDPYRPLPSKVPPLEVQVVSLDWKWLFIYPQHGIAAVNELVVPVGVPLHFTLTSASVMNVFFVPQLGSMIYTMNGMASQLHLQADTPGTYRGISAHFSGAGFPEMHFPVRALPADAYEAWLSQARRSDVALDDTVYAALARQSTGAPPMVFGKVQQGLFRRILTQQIPPAPGPPLHGQAQKGER